MATLTPARHGCKSTEQRSDAPHCLTDLLVRNRERRQEPHRVGSRRVQHQPLLEQRPAHEIRPVFRAECKHQAGAAHVEPEVGEPATQQFPLPPHLRQEALVVDHVQHREPAKVEPWSPASSTSE